MLSRFLSRLEETVIALLLVGATLLVFVEVILRFGFNTGLLWSHELTLLMVAWFVLLGASYGIKKGAHIGVDIVVRMLPGAARRAAGLLASLLCLLYCGLLGYGAWVYLAKMFRIGIPLEDLPVPLWIGHGVLLLGFALLALRLAEVSWRILTGRLDRLLLADEARSALGTSRRSEGAEPPDAAP